MKLLFALFLLACCSKAGLQAQPGRLEVKAGGSVTTIVGPGLNTQPRVQPLAGLLLGASRRLPLSPAQPLLLQVELFYSQQGYRLVRTAPVADYQATVRLHYVSVPLLFVAEHRRWWVGLGPQAGYLVGVREQHQGVRVPGAVGGGTRVSTDARGYPRWDAAGVAAAGCRWASGVGVEVRHTHSLTSI